MYVLRIVIELLAATGAHAAESSVFLEILKAAITAFGPIAAALIVGVAGALITSHYAAERERMEVAAVDDRHRKDLEALEKRHDLDKESEWRAHAVELTKLEFQRKFEAWKLITTEPKPTIRPVILDFLAIYRDLKELDNVTPKELYQKIEDTRITRQTRTEPPANPPDVEKLRSDSGLPDVVD